MVGLVLDGVVVFRLVLVGLIVLVGFVVVDVLTFFVIIIVVVAHLVFRIEVFIIFERILICKAYAVVVAEVIAVIVIARRLVVVS
jgi:hypothetical protein